MLADAGYVVGPLLLGAIADAAAANTALAFTAVLLVTTSTLFGLLAPETYRSHGGRPKPASDAPAPALTAPEKSAD